jgi:hypothetical protein
MQPVTAAKPTNNANPNTFRIAATPCTGTCHSAKTSGSTDLRSQSF